MPVAYVGKHRLALRVERVPAVDQREQIKGLRTFPGIILGKRGRTAKQRRQREHQRIRAAEQIGKALRGKRHNERA